MTNSAGSFVWYELMTPDLDRALAFYPPVVGWETQDSGLSEHRYMVLNANGKGIGGMMEMPPEAAANGAPAQWLGYVAVDDIDATVARITAAGGALHHGPAEIPGVGRFASMTDPQRAAFVLFQTSVEGFSDACQMGTPGHVGWNELHAADGEAALAFYAAQFGWRQTEALDMGEMGLYRLFAVEDGNPMGGMMTSPNFPRPSWLYYFCVDDIDAAAKRVTDHGGTVNFGPAEVPGGAWIIQCADPTGVLFALVGMRR